VDLASAKEHLRVGHNDDDAYITRLTHAAQLVCENLTGQVFTPMSFEYICDNWEQTKTIPEIGKLTRINRISYWDSKIPSVFQTFSGAYYTGDFGSIPNRIFLNPGISYPNLRDGNGNIVITLNAIAPWETTLPVPPTGLNEIAFQAVLITISDMYENRQSVIVGRIASSIPKTAEYLLNRLKIQTL